MQVKIGSTKDGGVHLAIIMQYVRDYVLNNWAIMAQPGFGLAGIPRDVEEVEAYSLLRHSRYRRLFTQKRCIFDAPLLAYSQVQHAMSTLHKRLLHSKHSTTLKV